MILHNFKQLVFALALALTFVLSSGLSTLSTVEAKDIGDKEKKEKRYDRDRDKDDDDDDDKDRRKLRERNRIRFDDDDWWLRRHRLHCTHRILLYRRL